MFIAFSGIDGSGKTTVSKALTERLKAAGLPTIWTYEPGDTVLGKAIRQLVLAPDRCYKSSEAEFMLFMADRAEHIESVIKPHLNQGKIVICDRYLESTLAYQGHKISSGSWKIETIHATMRWPVPDLSFFLDADPEIASERTAARRSEETDPNLEEMRALRQRYLDHILFKNSLLNKSVIINVNKPLQDVIDDIEKTVLKRIQENKARPTSHD